MSAHFLIRLLSAEGRILAEAQDDSGLIEKLQLERNPSRCIRDIDPYGDTFFYDEKAKELTRYVEQIDPLTPLLTAQQLSTLEQLNVILAKCMDTPKSRVAFYGD